MIPPLRIVLSGGGIRAVAHSGALQALEEVGLLRAVKEYVGLSAGALIAFCVTIGYSFETLRNFSEKFDFSQIRNLDPDTIFLFLETFGVDNAARLRKFLESLLKQKGLSPEITFAEFYAQAPAAPKLRIFAADIFTCRPFEFSVTTTPGAKMVDALHASMAIPGYFVPFQEPTTGHFLVDGGALNNNPLVFLPLEEQKHALSIGFSMDHVQVKEISSIGDYFHQVYACFFMPRHMSLVEEHSDKLIIIPCGEYPMWDFEAGTDVRKEMIEKGYQAVRIFLSTRHRSKIARRFSVV
jgi:predicted acylesterase/phospholipase RssA